MAVDPAPIAYTALTPGTPVHSSDGEPFGTVESVLVVEEVDVFDGIVVATAVGTRFVDADWVGSIFTSHVVTTLSTEEAANLPLPDDAPIYGVDASDDTTSSVADTFGRMFGRGKWTRKQ